MMRSEGFSFVEVLVAASLMLGLVAALLGLIGPARDALWTQPDAADMQQRARVAADALGRDLANAGAGPYIGAPSGAALYFFAPVLPYRTGTRSPDAPGAFRADTLTLLYVPTTAAQTTLASPGPGAVSGMVTVNIDAACPEALSACGFETGMGALIFDEGGRRDIFTVTSVAGQTLELQANSAALMSTAYASGRARIVQVISVMYALRADATTGAFQLVRTADGSPETAVMDHLVGLTFHYEGDPHPPRLNGKPIGVGTGPWTTYGPAPPPIDMAVTGIGYPPGENCAFSVDPATGSQVPRLPELPPQSGASLVELPASLLTDGPWCPDDTSSNRWDADLLRIRRISVTLRVQAANRALRGPAGVLFTNGGTSTNPARWLPDLQITLRVAPRNLQFE